MGDSARGNLRKLPVVLPVARNTASTSLFILCFSCSFREKERNVFPSGTN
jgi:hypothetical protein